MIHPVIQVQKNGSNVFVIQNHHTASNPVELIRKLESGSMAGFVSARKSSPTSQRIEDMSRQWTLFCNTDYYNQKLIITLSHAQEFSFSLSTTAPLSHVWSHPHLNFHYIDILASLSV